jgi:hypothetical protein
MEIAHNAMKIIYYQLIHVYLVPIQVAYLLALLLSQMYAHVQVVFLDIICLLRALLVLLVVKLIVQFVHLMHALSVCQITI